MDDITYNFNAETINRFGGGAKICKEDKLEGHSMGFTSPHPEFIMMNNIFSSSFIDAPTFDKVKLMSQELCLISSTDIDCHLPQSVKGKMK